VLGRHLSPRRFCGSTASKTIRSTRPLVSWTGSRSPSPGAIQPSPPLVPASSPAPDIRSRHIKAHLMPPAGRLSRPPILFCKSGLTAGRIAHPMRSASRNSDAISTSLLEAVDPLRSPIGPHGAGLALSTPVRGCSRSGSSEGVDRDPLLSVGSSDGSDRNQRSASDRRTTVRRPTLRAISRPAVISS
jgi:hypothetical protein